MNTQNELGAIEPGKRTDLIANDRDVLTISLKEMREAKILRTMVAGKISRAELKFFWRSATGFF